MDSVGWKHLSLEDGERSIPHLKNSLAKRRNRVGGEWEGSNGAMRGEGEEGERKECGRETKGGSTKASARPVFSPFPPIPALVSPLSAQAGM